MLTATDTIVCFGDSLTACGEWQDLLMHRFSAQFLNAGVGGNTSVQGLARFENDVLPHHPSAVIIGFGTNDQVIYDPTIGPQVSLEDFSDTMETILRCVRQIDAVPILLTPCTVDPQAYYSRHPKAWCEPYGGVETMLESYRQVLRDLADKHQVLLVDIGALSDTCPQNVLGQATDSTFDGVHPSAQGRALFAKWIGDAIEPLFA